jgi:hypothetical protein
MKAFANKFVPWLTAALLCAGAILVATDAGLDTRRRYMAGAALLVLLVVCALRLVLKAMAATRSNVIEHAPEMSSLAFPPSSFRK